VKWEKRKILRNDWKKVLLVVDMVIIKLILKWGKFMRETCDLQEGPQTWCNSSNMGARVKLLLQVGDPHLYFLVKFYNLICYWCEMWITERWILEERRKSLRNDADILYSILNVCVFKVNGCCVNCQVMKLSLIKKYEKCDLGHELAYI